MTSTQVIKTMKFRQSVFLLHSKICIYRTFERNKETRGTALLQVWENSSTDCVMHGLLFGGEINKAALQTWHFGTGKKLQILSSGWGGVADQQGIMQRCQLLWGKDITQRGQFVLHCLTCVSPFSKEAHRLFLDEHVHFTLGKRAMGMTVS